MEEHASPEFMVEISDEPLIPGSSRPVKIRLAPRNSRAVLRYTVTGSEGAVIQSKEFNLVPDVDEVDWYVKVPSGYKQKYVRVSVALPSEAQAKAIDVAVQS